MKRSPARMKRAIALTSNHGSAVRNPVGGRAPFPSCLSRTPMRPRDYREPRCNPSTELRAGRPLRARGPIGLVSTEVLGPLGRGQVAARLTANVSLPVVGVEIVDRQPSRGGEV